MEISYGVIDHSRVIVQKQLRQESTWKCSLKLSSNLFVFFLTTLYNKLPIYKKTNI